MKTILEMLAPGEYVSGEAISRVLGVSRAAVWKLQLFRSSSTSSSIMEPVFIRRFLPPCTRA